MGSQIAVIKATLKYNTQEELIRGMAPLITRRGLFIHTRTTRPVGSEVHFEFQLADGSQTYSGEGIVRKEIPFVGGPSSQKSGMLIALRRINRPFKQVVDAILNPTDNDATPAPAPAQPVRAPAPEPGQKQLIVESRAGESEGFDLFGELDMDRGMDSLFAGIEKSTPDSNAAELIEKPMVVSGLLMNPVAADGVALDYNAQYDADDGYEFDEMPTTELGDKAAAPRDDSSSTRTTGEYESAEAIAAREAMMASEQASDLASDLANELANEPASEQAAINEAVNAGINDIISDEPEANPAEAPIPDQSEAVSNFLAQNSIDAYMAQNAQSSAQSAINDYLAQNSIDAYMAKSQSGFLKPPESNDVERARAEMEQLKPHQASVTSVVEDVISDTPSSGSLNSLNALTNEIQQTPEDTGNHSVEACFSEAPSQELKNLLNDVASDGTDKLSPEEIGNAPTQINDVIDIDSMDLPRTETAQYEFGRDDSAAQTPAAAPERAVVSSGLRRAPSDGANPAARRARRAESPAAPAARKQVSLESVLKQAEKSAEDIIMTNVSATKPAPRRRVNKEPEPEIPTAKKGFFSNLFNKK